MLSMLAQYLQLDQTRRQHRLHIANQSISFLIEAFAGSRGINQHGQYDLIVLGTDASIALKPFIDQQACISTLLPNGSLRQRTGYINRITFLEADGALSRFHIQLCSGSWYLAQNCHNRIFSNKSTLDIVRLLLADLPEKLAFSIDDSALDHAPANKVLISRTQYQQSSWQFLQGLLSDAGLSWVVLEGNPTQSAQDDVSWRDLLSDSALSNDDLLIPQHHVRIFRDSNLLPQVDSGSLHYATNTIMQADDSLFTLNLKQHTIVPSITVRADSNGQAMIYEGRAYHGETSGEISTDNVWVAPPSRVTSHEQAQQLAQDALEATNCHSVMMESFGCVRALQVGQRASLYTDAMPAYADNLPEILIYQHDELAFEPLPNSSIDVINSRLGSYEQFLSTLIPDSLQSIECMALARQRGFVHHSKAIPADVPWRTWPVCLQVQNSLNHALSEGSGLKIARSVDASGGTGNGSQGHGSYVTDMSEVHVQYPWAKHSPHDDAVHPPVRVMQRQHGAQQSLQQLPRLGQDVLLGYLYDDLDSPYIQASIFNGIGAGDQDTDSLHRLDSNADSPSLAASVNPKQGNSPLWHGAGDASRINQKDNHQGALSGVVSHTIEGSQRSQLMFDDSDAANAIVLSQSAMNNATNTQAWHRPDQRVELGELQHRVDNHRDAKRGQGIDIFSQFGMTLGAGKGLLLASYQISHTDSQHQMAFERTAANALLKQQHQTAKALSETLQQHQRAETKTHPLSEQLQQDVNQQMLKQLQNKVNSVVDASPEYAAMTLLNGKAGLNSTAQNQHLIAPKQHLQSGASQHWNASNIKLHSQHIELTGGLSKDGEVYVGANGEHMAIQAHGGMLHVDSQQQLQIASQNGVLSANAAKEIVIGTAGGASITIGSGGIKVSCPGTLTIQAGKREHVGGGAVSANKIFLPQAKTKFSNKINYFFESIQMNHSRSDSKSTSHPTVKELFIVEEDTDTLLFQRQEHQNTSNRFHTQESKDFTALLFRGDTPSPSQELVDWEDNTFDDMNEEETLAEDKDFDIESAQDIDEEYDE